MPDFEKSNQIKIYYSSSSGETIFHADRQKDRHNEANSRALQFCESY